MLRDFKIKFIIKYDKTFWLHLLREFIITFALSWISVQLAIGIAVGFNLAWEVQDGLKGWGCKHGVLQIEGFNWIDFVGGCIGITITLLIKTYLI